MSKRTGRLIAGLGAVAAFALLSVATPETAEAHILRRSAARQNYVLTSVTNLNEAMGGVTPSCCAPVPSSCCQTPCCRPNVCYRGCNTACCDPCKPPIKQTLTFCHPCTGCKVAVDVCLPGCCTGCPSVSERCTLIGCGAVTYRWCCGFSATVRFARCGDVTVIYR